MQCEIHSDVDVGLVISDVTIRMMIIHASNHYGGSSLARACQLAFKSHSCGLEVYYVMLYTYVHQPASKPLGGAGIFVRGARIFSFAHYLNFSWMRQNSLDG